MKDIVSAILSAVTRGDRKILQLGTTTSTSINQLIITLEKVHGHKLTWEYKPARAGEIRDSLLDHSKAAAVLKWRPFYPLEKGLHETYESVMKNNV